MIFCVCHKHVKHASVGVARCCFRFPHFRMKEHNGRTSHNPLLTVHYYFFP